jgi:uncharacterized membrane protein
MIDMPVPGASLPNLHPALVHFPIALWLAAIIFDLACLLLRRYRWIDHAAAALYTLGAAGAAAAYLAGEQAEDSLHDVPAALETLIQEHADLGWWTLVIFFVVASARLGVAALNRRDEHQRLAGLRWVVLLGALGGGWVLIETADHGGALVYGHGLAVSSAAANPAPSPASPAVEPPAATSPAASPDSSPAESHLLLESDGSMTWTPGPNDTAGLGTILSEAPGSDPQAVSFASAPEAEAAGEGLPLRIKGRGLLLLPSKWNDVQLEAVVDLTGLDGAVGLAHHAHGVDDVGVFQVSSKGLATLVHFVDGGTRQLDESSMALPAQPMKITVSLAGQHLKGMVNGKVVAHGHEHQKASGSVGLLLDGTGIVRILSIKVQPLSRP